MALLLVAGQTAVIYLFLIAALARLGRPHMASLNLVAYLSIALLGSAVETGLYRGSDSLWAGLVSAATLLAVNAGLSALAGRWPRLRRWLAGAPVILVYNGQVIHTNLRKVYLTEEALRAAVRKRGYDDLRAVRLAVIEPNGAVGVVPTQGKQESDPADRPADTSRPRE